MALNGVIGKSREGGFIDQIQNVIDQIKKTAIFKKIDC